MTHNLKDHFVESLATETKINMESMYKCWDILGKEKKLSQEILIKAHKDLVSFQKETIPVGSSGCRKLYPPKTKRSF